MVHHIEAGSRAAVQHDLAGHRLKTYIGDTGTQVILDCGQNITAATASGTNSIAFTTLAGTFDQAGVWRLQAKVTLPTGTWRGETATRTVAEAFG